MLTEKERKWLEEREEKHFICRYCTHTHIEKTHCQYVPPFYNQWCYLFAENQDWEYAAEFEARVAAKLASMDYEDVPCAHGMKIFCPRPDKPKQDCGTWCLMREARLAVEAEMES